MVNIYKIISDFFDLYGLTSCEFYSDIFGVVEVKIVNSKLKLYKARTWNKCSDFIVTLDEYGRIDSNFNGFNREVYKYPIIRPTFCCTNWLSFEHQFKYSSNIENKKFDYFVSTTNFFESGFSYKELCKVEYLCRGCDIVDEYKNVVEMEHNSHNVDSNEENIEEKIDNKNTNQYIYKRKHR